MTARRHAMTVGICGLFSCLILTPCVASADDLADAWRTVAEGTGYDSTASYQQTLEYIERVEANSPWVRMLDIGVTPQGRPLKLVVVSRHQAFDPRAARGTAKAVVLIQNGIHAGEIAGKDASLALLREIAITKLLEHLLDHVVLLIVPVFNVDGHENVSPYHRANQIGPTNMGFRATANRFNLNRDYIKADAPEMRAWIAMFNQWTPDLVVDNHVTDGMDHQYAITYMMPWHPIDAPRIVEWTTTLFEPEVLARLKTMKRRALPYVGARDKFDLGKGVRGFVSPPRFSTGYTAIRNRPSVLVEMHSLKDFRTRVEGNFDMMVAILESVNAHYRELQRAVDLSDNETMQGLTGPYALWFRPLTDDSTMIEFRGYRQTTDSSAITNGRWVRYHTGTRETATIPYFHRWVTSITVDPPSAYLIPREWEKQIELLGLHGIELQELTDSVTLTVETVRFDSVTFAAVPYESHVRPTYQTRMVEETRTFPAGTVVVSLKQKTAKVALHCLEPDGIDSFVKWGLWNQIFERTSYVEDYSIEAMAPRMLAEDSAPAVAYWAKVEADSVFADDVGARRNFFYERSPYFETTKDLYPVVWWRGDGALPTTRYLSNETKRRMR